ncbi:MAG: 5'-3' exonuclease H3TH domain-containing protein, partial [Myxococcota bacterium]
MANAPRLVLVDGSAMFFRAYYAIPGNLRTSSGQPTNAIYGFATMFRNLFSGRIPERGAVVFDAPGPTFRTQTYAAYKANRERPPDDLTSQRPWVDRVVEAYGFPILRVRGFEADDVIGTLTARAVQAGMEVTIVSADKDFMQLLGPSVKMFDPFNGVAGITYDVDAARKKWGIPPAKFVDFLGLLGDKIDNIPGVPGIGKKGASDLLERYGDLESVLAHVDELKGRQKTALETHAADARLSRDLARIDLQVPLTHALTDLDLPPLDDKALYRLYTELEFYSLLTEEQVSAAEEAASDDAVDVVDEAHLAEWLARETETAVALEPAWDAPAISARALVGLALARESKRSIYVDLRGELPARLAAWLESDAPKRVHDGKVLRVLLQKRGVALEGVQLDLQLASFLIDPNKLIPHRLDQVSKE